MLTVDVAPKVKFMQGTDRPHYSRYFMTKSPRRQVSAVAVEVSVNDAG